MKIEMDGWRLRLTFSAAHVMIGHAKCGRLHGHDYAVSIRLEGEPGESGVIMDFGLLKENVREILEQLDHKFLLGVKNRAVEIAGDEAIVRSDESQYRIPLRDCAILEIDQTSAEEIARWFGTRLKEKLTGVENVTVLEVKIEEGVGQGVWLTIDL